MRYLNALLLCSALLPVLGRAQWLPPATNAYATKTGLREFTLGGSAAANKDFDNTLGGINFSYGTYINETQEWVLRQSINYANPDRGGASWNGATRLAFDQHLTARGSLRPFVGVNFGGVYGDAVRDTFAAGLEAGGKFYVQERTFIYVMVEYGWFFRRASTLDDGFRGGQFNGGVGVGFNF